MTLLDRSARIYVAGHGGLVGSAVVRHLRAEGFDNLLTATRDQLDLRDQAAVNYWFRANRVMAVSGALGLVVQCIGRSTSGTMPSMAIATRLPPRQHQ